MKKDTRQRLFEMMEKVNPDFKQRLSENVVRSTNVSEPTLDLTRKYNVGTKYKPNGLWYEIDNEWKEYCQFNAPEGSVKNYDIILDIDFSNIIILDTPEKAIEFAEMYKIPMYPNNPEIEIYAINWNAVAEKYKGIEIPDFGLLKNDERLRWEDWIYTWDASSGCIWDLSAIKNYKAVDCDAQKYSPPSIDENDDTKKPKLLLPVGISGSGKSTWIKANTDSNTVIVSPDDIRRELTGSVSDQRKNGIVWSTAFDRIVNALNNGKDVILDATNIKSSDRKRLMNHLKVNVDKPFDAFAKIFNVDPNIAKQRVRKDIEAGVDRSNVPDFVIDRQYQDFIDGVNTLETDGFKIID